MSDIPLESKGVSFQARIFYFLSFKIYAYAKHSYSTDL